MASMGPFPSERTGRDIDDLPIWRDWDSYPCEWNEFYCSKSWNISPVSFQKFPLSPPTAPYNAKEEVVKKRSIKTSATKRRCSTESINSENSRQSRKSRDDSVKSKKEQRSSTKSSDKVSKPKSDKKNKKKKSKEDRKSSVCSADSLNSANQESSTEFNSSSFRISKPSKELSASFSCLSPSMRSLNDSRSSITGCDSPVGEIGYIDDLEQTRPQSEPLLNTSTHGEAKRCTKKAKKKTKKQKTKSEKQAKSPRTETVSKKKPSPTAKATIIMETLPEEVLVSTCQSHSDHSRVSLLSPSPKRSHRFSKLMVVADGSIRRAVDRRKGSFWEQSANRRGSVRRSIHSALGEITAGVDESIHLFDDDDAKLGLEYKTAERSVSTETTDPWNNSWSISSDSFHDNSERLKNASLLLSKSPEMEHKTISPF